MSWTAFITPLHVVGTDTLAWAANASISHGVPDRIPPTQSLPTVAEAFAALRAAGCHGDRWFTVDGVPGDALLPSCGDRRACPERGGLDLGEVSVAVVGQTDRDRPLGLDQLVESMSLRKPAGVGILHAAVALAAIGGPQLVFDDSADCLVVVSPDDRPEDLTSWPW